MNRFLLAVLLISVVASSAGAATSDWSPATSFAFGSLRKDHWMYRSVVSLMDEGLMEDVRRYHYGRISPVAQNRFSFAVLTLSSVLGLTGQPLSHYWMGEPGEILDLAAYKSEKHTLTPRQLLTLAKLIDGLKPILAGNMTCDTEAMKRDLKALVVEPKPFADVPQDHWAYSAVRQLQNLEILKGYPEGRFTSD